MVSRAISQRFLVKHHNTFFWSKDTQLNNVLSLWIGRKGKTSWRCLVEKHANQRAKNSQMMIEVAKSEGASNNQAIIRFPNQFSIMTSLQAGGNWVIDGRAINQAASMLPPKDSKTPFPSSFAFFVWWRSFWGGAFWLGLSKEGTRDLSRKCRGRVEICAEKRFCWWWK